MGNLMDVSIVELLMIWSELTECYHKVNGYSGKTCEIYSYRLQKYDPSIQIKTNLPEFYINTAKSLLSIVEEFCRRYHCNAKIDELPRNKWIRKINSGEIVFDHRAHVRIIR